MPLYWRKDDYSDARTAICHQVKLYRTSLGLTQRDISQALGCSPSCISHIESAKMSQDDYDIVGRYYALILLLLSPKAA
jgi:transcriptional regulator with XRE-family HTH domain